MRHLRPRQPAARTHHRCDHPGRRKATGYYGYEATTNPDAYEWSPDIEWCFQLKLGNGFEVTIPYSELGTKAIGNGMFDVIENLLAGIAVCIERDILRLPDQP